MTVSRPLQLALLCASLAMLSNAVAGPREVRMQSANGSGGACPDATAEDDSQAPQQRTTRRKAAGDGKVRATPMVRDGGDSSSARPRWHSILPGMIR